MTSPPVSPTVRIVVNPTLLGGSKRMDRNSGRGEPPSRGEDYVFLSYARADEKAARAIIKLIERAGFRVWWDGLIPSGERFSAKISEALEAAGAVVVLWSANSAKSNWVQDEASFARDHQRLVPILIDGSEPPLGFRQLQCVDVSRGGLRASNPAMFRALQTIADMMDRPLSAAVNQRRGGIDRRGVITAGAAAGVAAVGFGGWQLLRPGRAGANTIAVLPFDNLSGEAGKGYLSDGLAAELRSTLSRNPLLRVVGQASSNEFRDRKDGSRSIARKLGVANLLDGNVLSEGGIVRIGIELIDGDNGFSRWSKRFELPMGNIIEVQEEIASSVGAALAVRLSDNSEQSPERSGGTRNVAAFDAYLRGKDLFDSQRDEDSDRGALVQFTDAVQLDPKYAAARAARSRTLAVIANAYAQATERRPLYDEAVAEARHAVATANQFADAYAALGYALFYGKLDIIAADEPYEKASQLGGWSADVLGLCAMYRARRRQFDRALPAIERAASLDPLNPTVFKNRGRIKFAAGDYAAAIEAARRAIDLNLKVGGAHGDIGNALLFQGHTRDAAAEFAQEKVQLLALPGRAFVAIREGKAAEAQGAYDELVKTQGDNGLYQQAQVLAQWNKVPQALDVLDKAVNEQDSGLVYLLSDPFLQPLQNQPRFNSLLKRLRFV
ncbi:TIR domain-containing protein [Sphingomonas sp. URHD0057]|uniref:TIR domain-containing protein n=1 Tax=Sphingomonas sp. URHD0057 TaxID=1380389 RepID=UPI0009E0B0CD|nr:TIR domain-containing protein [Sphingomonas sp. URHD0057]